MSRGIVVLAQNTEKDDYVLQACLLALSVRKTNTDTKVSIITNDAVNDEYVFLFDKIIPIPFNDDAKDSNWKIENRWKIYHATPYDETLVLDTDTLVLQDLDNWWKFFSNYEMYFTSNVYCYRNNIITNDYYRRAFTANNLPNLYTGCHYFKKCSFAQEFYKWMELITQNWELFYGQYIKEHYPDRPSMDVTAALAAKIMDCTEQVTNKNSKIPHFVHMKPRIQDWTEFREKWQEIVPVYLDRASNIKIGNYIQRGIFHYTEKDFVSRDLFENFKEVVDV